MQTESIELGFLSIFALITFFTFFIISKFSIKIKNGILLDNDYSKPQAFHDAAIPRCGGLAGYISLMIFLGIYFLLYSTILFEYIFICSCLFLVGFLDDIKKNISPKKRLILMIIFLVVLINILPIKIFNIDLIFLNFWMQNKFFSTLFIVLCFLFIVNGANLVDGFNGLLTINLIIINSILLFINLNNNAVEFSVLLTAQIIIFLVFLMFNFPTAKIFLGDSGSYLFGSLTALNTVLTNNFNPSISSFFFCILLFYLFFEVFFSFIRKIYQKKSPFLPDDLHLHMLLYKRILNNYDANKSNYYNSIIINLIFFFCILPSIYFADNSIFCKYWFFFLILIYTMIYYLLYYLTKKKIDI